MYSCGTVDILVGMPSARGHDDEQARLVEASAARRATAYAELRKLGREHARLRSALEANTLEILKVVKRERDDIEITSAAAAAGVGRTTVHRWLREHPDVR